jgi:glycosyltransferase involved in cell wall biosynthesis
MLAADRIAFNSRYHHDAWFSELPRFLRHFPEYNELASVDALRAKSHVIPVGIDCGESAATGDGAIGGEVTATAGDDEPPLVIWNQRWEYDKKPEQMIRALREVAARGVSFRVAICGQTFGDSPSPFDDVREAFGARLAHFGFAAPERYRQLLDAATVTLSTADHEFFGIAVLEAMARGTFALLPDRLSYPELLSGPELSESTRNRCLYNSHAELVDGLCRALESPRETAGLGAELARNARRFDWASVSSLYDQTLESLAVSGGRGREADPPA